VFGTTHLRSTLHLPAAAPRWSAALARPTSEVEPTAGLLRRVEHTLAAQAATAHIEGIDVARPLSMSFAPPAGVLRLEFAAPALAGVDALLHHLAALLALEGVSRVEVRVVHPATGATLGRRSLEVPTHP
jgi:hypothetical protein